jgi:hypothetical protein
MKAAIVVEAGHAPVYGDFEDPVPGPGQSVVRVTASSISHVTKARASGTHYSSEGGFRASTAPASRRMGGESTFCYPSSRTAEWPSGVSWTIDTGSPCRTV